MSIWNCETHGRTAPSPCCQRAVREGAPCSGTRMRTTTPERPVTEPVRDPVAEAVEFTVAELRDAIARCEDIVKHGQRDEMVWTRDLAILLSALREAREDGKRLDWMLHNYARFWAASRDGAKDGWDTTVYFEVADMTNDDCLPSRYVARAHLGVLPPGSTDYTRMALDKLRALPELASALYRAARTGDKG